MYAIVLLPVIPVRSDDREAAEMVSQLLYGELVEILEISDRWTKIRNFADNYIGWVDKKMLSYINDEQELNSIVESPSFKLNSSFSQITNNLSQTVFLSGSSIIRPHYPKFHGGANLTFENQYSTNPKIENGVEIVQIAQQYLNTPYLWGGKTIFGIDCSGLVQVVYGICGYQLPRDASQQITCGNVVNSLSDANTGDLVFFKNQNGRIHHVGILMDGSHVIHASGWVKCELIDNTGIISNISGEYTHHLEAIRRIVS